MSQVLGKLIAGRYRVDALIGAGGAGSVYRATQEPLNRTVAVKTLRAELACNPSLRRRFEREARAIASLHHVNIATVHDFGTDDDGDLYLAMEFVEGTSLAELLESETVSFSTLRRIFDQILAGLAHAHGRGVIHRDVKPANVLIQVDEDGEPLVKIVDFGIATQADRAQAELPSEGIVGTPHFMAPEQARGDAHLTPAVDVYTTGLMLYWATTGRHAFDGATPREVMDAQCNAPLPSPIWRADLAVPEGLERLLEDALRKDPGHRIGTASAFRDRLRALAGGVRRTALEASAPRPPSPQAPVATARRRTLLESLEHTLLAEDEAQQPALAAAPSPRADAPPAAPGPQGLRSQLPLIGRQEDRGLLIEAGNRILTERRGLIVALEGEAGLGKSTLARWLRDQLTEVSGYRGIQGTFHREGERGLRGIREAVESLFQARGISGERLHRLIEDRLHQLGMHAAEDHERLTSFIRPGSGPVSAAAAERGVEMLFDLLVRVLEAASHEQPLVALIDDVHFAGPETASFLEYLAAEMDHRAMRLMLVVSIQTSDVDNEAVEQLAGRLSRFEGNTVLRRRLGRLDTAQAERLVSSMLNATDQLAARIVERAAGNPMHIVQLTRYLRDEQLLAWTARGWDAAPGVDVLQVLPPSLADTLALRIEQVEAHPEAGERVRALLNRLAILGMSTPFRVLEHLLEIEGRQEILDRVDEDIDLILDEELLTMVEKRDDDILSFPTSLVRDVVLRRLRNRRTTRKLHALAARAKIETLRGGPEKIAAELVEHYAGARDRVSELQAARMVAEAAERNHRPHDAIHYYQRSLDLLDDLPEPPADAAEQRRDINLRTALLSLGFGEFDRARDAFQRVLDDAETPADSRISALYGLADLAWMQGRFDDADTWARQGLDCARDLEIPDAPTLQGRGLLSLARVAWHRGRTERTEALVHEALDLVQTTDNDDQRAEVLWFQADIARGRGDIARAEELFQEALALFRSLNHQRGIAKCQAKLAVTARMRNDLDAAARRYRRALHIYERLGARRGVAHQLNGLGDVARFRGDLALAADHYRRAVEMFQQIGVPFDAAIALTNLGVVARDSENHAAAADAFERALQVCEAIGYPYLILGVKLNLALGLALAGDRARADQLLAESIHLTSEVELVDPDYALPLERMADLKRADGAPEDAAPLYALALAMWQDLGREEDVARVQARMAEADAAPATSS